MKMTSVQRNFPATRPRPNRPPSKILVDGGDVEETKHIKQLLGYVDGQTTNPSLIAKNPEIKRLVSSGHALSESDEVAEYRRIVREISPLVGDAGVSVEVFADVNTGAEQMLKQGREMFTWISNAYIKFPCTPEGLKATHRAVAEGIRVNVTLCFSQQQAAAVYAATRGSKSPAYVSPFVGRLDDIGQNGVDLVRNIKRMYSAGDGHVFVLAASIRNLQHLLYCFQLGVDLVTVPAKVLEEWVSQGCPLPEKGFEYEPVGTRIHYQELDLEQPWQNFDVRHELTTKGIAKFVADYRATLRKPA